MRTGEFEYTAYFNIENREASRIRYIGHRDNGYTTYWYFIRDDIDDFVYNSNNFTVVGNMAESLSFPEYEQNKTQLVIFFCLIFITILFGFFVFRVHKRGYSL